MTNTKTNYDTLAELKNDRELTSSLGQFGLGLINSTKSAKQSELENQQVLNNESYKNWVKQTDNVIDLTQPLKLCFMDDKDKQKSLGTHYNNYTRDELISMKVFSKNDALKDYSPERLVDLLHLKKEFFITLFVKPYLCSLFEIDAEEFGKSIPEMRIDNNDKTSMTKVLSCLASNAKRKKTFPPFIREVVADINAMQTAFYRTQKKNMETILEIEKPQKSNNEKFVSLANRFINSVENLDGVTLKNNKDFIKLFNEVKSKVNQITSLI
tara:strand:- start:447 stop:1253 length:807 start_codon:yes stop_codon:yes gene_type:complete